MWWLMTSETLIDIYNDNIEYGNLYENYDDSDSDEEETSSNESSITSKSKYTSTSSSYDSYKYDEDIMENYIYLLKLKSFIGDCDDSLLIGVNLKDYMSNNKLLCASLTFKENDNLQYLLSKSTNFKCETDEPLIKKKITNLYNNIIDKIFTYDFVNRIKCKDIINYLDK
jgi:hypothetical protein